MLARRGSRRPPGPCPQLRPPPRSRCHSTPRPPELPPRLLYSHSVNKVCALFVPASTRGCLPVCAPAPLEIGPIRERTSPTANSQKEVRLKPPGLGHTFILTQGDGLEWERPQNSPGRLAGVAQWLEHPLVQGGWWVPFHGTAQGCLSSYPDHRDEVDWRKASFHQAADLAGVCALVMVTSFGQGRGLGEVWGQDPHPQLEAGYHQDRCTVSSLL